MKVSKTFQGFILLYTLNLRVRKNHKYKDQGNPDRPVSGDESDWSAIDKKQKRVFSAPSRP